MVGCAFLVKIERVELRLQLVDHILVLVEVNISAHLGVLLNVLQELVVVSHLALLLLAGVFGTLFLLGVHIVLANLIFIKVL